MICIICGQDEDNHDPIVHDAVQSVIEGRMKRANQLS